jgi:hypothetical protein
MRVTDTSTAVLVLALEMLGERGEHWLKGDFGDSNGKYCMVGAVFAARQMLKTTDDMCIRYLENAVGRESVITFNDRKCRKFSDVRKMFNRAISMSLCLFPLPQDGPQLTLPWFTCGAQLPNNASSRRNAPATAA